MNKIKFYSECPVHVNSYSQLQDYIDFAKILESKEHMWFINLLSPSNF